MSIQEFLEICPGEILYKNDNGEYFDISFKLESGSIYTHVICSVTPEDNKQELLGTYENESADDEDRTSIYSKEGHISNIEIWKTE